MDFYYEFFDRAALDALWEMPWKEYLLRWGSTHWARAEAIGEDIQSLRDTIAFFVQPKPDADEVERILSCETIRWTIKRSEPQFGLMSELIFNTPGFRRHAQSITYKGDYFVVLMAAAAEAYLRGRIPKTMLWPVFKLHATDDPGQRLELTPRDHRALKAALSGREMWVPIYRWQGATYLEDEQWANCLGVADTKRFVAVVARAWKENWPVPRLGELSRIEIPPPKSGPPRFRDCGVWEAFARPVIRRVAHFDRPCVFFEWL